ncbi:SEC-C metal-binding domain-containing protein [Nonomuraea basaltis]|uniref:SEC-C metal-binding domain-containing protein n=1 Tax=Nonomuraea basaltis TaxID=2495887 RepID=UPI00197CDB0A
MIEKLGANDLCPCGSGRRFPPLLPFQRQVRRRARALLRTRPPVGRDVRNRPRNEHRCRCRDIDHRPVLRR